MVSALACKHFVCYYKNVANDGCGRKETNMSILVLANDLLIRLNQLKGGYKLQQFTGRGGHDHDFWCLKTPKELIEFDDITEVVDFLDDELEMLRAFRDDKSWWAMQDEGWSLKKHGKSLDDAVDAYMGK